MNKQPTILDVAKRSGFSKSTVSLVLQDSPIIPDKTKLLVREAMSALGYRRNRFARSLRTRRSHAIGMLIQDHLNPFYAEIVQYVEQRLRNHGYDLLVSSSNTNPDTELLVIERLFSMQVDGMIVSTTDYAKVKPLLASMQKQGTHFVIAGAAYPGIPFDAATINDSAAMRAVMEHLFRLGHREIGFIWGAPEFQAIGARFDVFRQELETAGLRVRDEWIKRCGFRIGDGYEAAKELLTMKNCPTAVFALNDLLALGTIRAARDLGLDVPGDVSVVGADNVKISMSFCPSLTTIDQPIEAYASALTDLVLSGIEQRSQVVPEAEQPKEAQSGRGRRANVWKPRRIELTAGFIARESTGAAIR